MTPYHVFCRIFFPILLLFPAGIRSQTSPILSAPPSATDSGKIIKIIRADRLTLIKVDNGTERYILGGNVLLQQDNTLFYCDSAVKDESLNTIEAFGNIHINDRDSVHTYAQYLKYLGDLKQATLRQKVKLTDGKGILTTETLNYDLNTRIGSYVEGGKLVNGSSVLTSRQGFYYADSKQVFFQNQVKLVDPEYTMVTDTMLYDLNQELATFIALTTINDGRSNIKTRSGFYNLRTGEAQFGKRPLIEDSTQQVVADSIIYDKKTGFGLAKGNVILKDTAQGLTVLAGQAEIDQKSGRLLASMKPVMILKRNNDSLFIAADTLLSGRRLRNIEPPTDSLASRDSLMISHQKQNKTIDPGKKTNPTTDSLASLPSETAGMPKERKPPVAQKEVKKPNSLSSANQPGADSVRYLLAYQHVRIFSDSLQGVCDSLSYSTEDSIFRFFRDPVLWARDSQVTGDTIFLQTKLQKPDQIHVLENGFSVSRTPESLYNQIRGNILFGQFVDGEIDFLRAKGSAESLYYLQAEDSSYFGLNYAKADAISLIFKNRELKRVTWVSGVEGVTYPFRQIPSDKRQLRGFKWREDQRPKSKDELFLD